MNSSPNIKLINLGILLSFGFSIGGFFLDIKSLEAIGFLALGSLFVIFHHSIATEQYKIDKSAQNEFLKKYIYASETVERNSFVVLIVGIGFLIGGALTALAILL